MYSPGKEINLITQELEKKFERNAFFDQTPSPSIRLVQPELPVALEKKEARPASAIPLATLLCPRPEHVHPELPIALDRPVSGRPQSMLLIARQENMNGHEKQQASPIALEKPALLRARSMATQGSTNLLSPSQEQVQPELPIELERPVLRPKSMFRQAAVNVLSPRQKQVQPELPIELERPVLRPKSVSRQESINLLSPRQEQAQPELPIELERPVLRPKSMFRQAAVNLLSPRQKSVQPELPIELERPVLRPNTVSRQESINLLKQELAQPELDRPVSERPKSILILAGQESTEGNIYDEVTVESLPTIDKCPETPKIRDERDEIASIVNEIITTEARFIHKLEHGLATYLEPVETDLNISTEYKEKFQNITVSIKKILNLHKLHFHPELLKCDNAILIAEVFLRHIDFLSDQNTFYMHVLYAIDKEKNAKIVDEKEEYFEQYAIENQDHLGINNCLMLPIQRITRYKLLMENVVKQLYKLCKNNENNSEDQNVMSRCTLAVYWIGRVLENANEAVFLNDIQFEENNSVDFTKFGIFLKGGELQIESSSKTNQQSFIGKLFAFEKSVIVTKSVRKSMPRTEFICQGMYEWRSIKLAVDYQPDSTIAKAFHIITRHDKDEIKFTFSKKDGMTIDDWANIFNSALMTDNRISTIASDIPNIAEVAQEIIDSDNILITEQQYIHSLIKNRDAYNEAVNNLETYIDKLNSVISFHSDVLLKDLQMCANDSKGVVGALSKLTSAETLKMYKTYAIEAGKTMNRLKSLTHVQHIKATMPFNELVTLPFKRIQVYSTTLEVLAKNEYNNDGSNLYLLHATATLNNKFILLHKNLLDYLQICTIENLSYYGQIVYTDIITVECSEKKKTADGSTRIIVMDRGLICVESKHDLIGNAVITKIIAHATIMNLTICPKSLKKSKPYIVFEKKNFPEIKFATLEKRNIFIDKLTGTYLPNLRK